MRRQFHPAGQDTVYRTGKEIKVFEIKQHTQIDQNGRDKNRLRLPLHGCLYRPLSGGVQ